MEIVLRATVLFCVLWLVSRASGKRELSQLSAFELVLLVTMGDLVQQGITQEDYSVTGAVLAVSVFALLSVLLSYASWRFPRSRHVLEGQPSVIVRDGAIDEEVMAAERLTTTELNEAARERGIRSLADVDLAILENNGTISFFERNRAGSAPD
jgi:uncharacterized membrane protein YcaP (DUF421 family)